MVKGYFAQGFELWGRGWYICVDACVMCVLKRRRQRCSLMGCHIPQCTPQHTDPLWLSDSGASVACFSNASSPASARQSRKLYSACIIQMVTKRMCCSFFYKAQGRRKLLFPDLVVLRRGKADIITCVLLRPLRETYLMLLQWEQIEKRCLACRAVGCLRKGLKFFRQGLAELSQRLC